MSYDEYRATDKQRASTACKIGVVLAIILFALPFIAFIIPIAIVWAGLHLACQAGADKDKYL